jgi:hypothetical protein
MKKNNLEILNEYFLAGTAEGDKSFLNNVFVPFKEYINIIKVPIGGPRILLGNKGSGKSALLRYFQSQLEEIDIPTIFLRPKDIKLDETKDTSLGALTRSCESAILKSIARKIGGGIHGLVLNDDDKKLLQVSKKEDGKNEDSIEKLVTILSPIGKKLTGIDFSKMKLGVQEIGAASIQSAVNSNLSRSDKILYVFIDDTDQISSPNESEQLNRIWSFFLASRSIMEECSNIKFIISLRDEIWRRLKRDEAGQRDQVDHFRNLAIKIKLNETEIKSIIAKRLDLVHEKLGKKSHDRHYELFFDTHSVRIPTAHEEFRSWDDFIVKRSRERPRDSIQLVYKLSDYAYRKNFDKINSDHVAHVMPVYSEERVDDLKRECDLECPQLKEIIRSFSEIKFDEGSFTLHPQTTAKFLSTLTTRFSITLLGKLLKADDSSNIFDLWRFLHEIGFLNARISDNRETQGFRHITSEDDPELVTKARWNDMQSLTWEIHPAYRDYLIKINNEKQFSFGLPKKIKKKY